MQVFFERKSKMGKLGPILTDLDSSCPRSLLKTAPPPPGYLWVSGSRHVTPEPRFSGLVLDHQSLEELELKKTPKNPCDTLNL